MNSHLNPNAAVFIPVSPTKLLMMDEAIISASSGVEFQETPCNLDYCSGPKQVDYFMRDNFSTLSNKSKEFNVPSACSELTNKAFINFTNSNSQEHVEHIPFDKLLANLTQKDISGEIGKLNFFGTTNVLIDNELESMNSSGNNNKITSTSEEKMSAPSSEHSIVHGTTTSTTVESSSKTYILPNNDQTEPDLPACNLPADTQVSTDPVPKGPDSSNIKDILPNNDQTEPDLPAHNLTADTEVSSDPVPFLVPLKESTPQKKKSKNSRNKFKRRSKKVEPNVNENNEGFTIEHRRSPPIDLTFKPIQTFSDANPFVALQTPTTTTPSTITPSTTKPTATPSTETPSTATPSTSTPTDQSYNLAELYKTAQKTPKSIEELYKPELNELDIEKNSQRSFILSRSPVDETIVPFEELESPNELIHFINPPNANKTNLAPELPESLEIQDKFEILSPKNSEHHEPEIDTDNKTGFNETEPDLFIDDGTTEEQETSFITVENSQVNKISDVVHLETSETFLKPEYKINQQQKECGNKSKLDVNVKFDSKTAHSEYDESCGTIISKLDKEIIPAFDDMKVHPCNFDIFSSIDSVPAKSEVDVDCKTNVNQTMDDPLVNNPNPESQETSYTNKNIQLNKLLLDTSSSPVLESEFGIMQLENNAISSLVCFKTEDQVPSINSNIKSETKQMKLELEHHVSISETTPEELKMIVQDFEVISKDELNQDNYSTKESEIHDEPYEANLQIVGKKEEFANLESPLNGVNLFDMNDIFTTEQGTSISPTVSVEDNISENDLFNGTDKFSEGVNVKVDISEHLKETEIHDEPYEANLQIVGKKEEVADLESPLFNLNVIFATEEGTSISQTVSVEDDISLSDLFNGTDKFGEGVNVKVDISEHLTLSPQSPEALSQIDLENTKPFIYQAPTPAEEQQKINTGSCDIRKEKNLSVLDEPIPELIKPVQTTAVVEVNDKIVEKEATPVLMDINSPLEVESVQSDPVYNIMEKEILIPSSEEANKAPLIESTDVHLRARNVPTTLFPQLEDNSQVQNLPEIDIFKSTSGENTDMSSTTAEKETKKEEESVKIKKPSDKAVKKTVETTTKLSEKPDVTTLAAKSGGAKTTTPVTKTVSGTKTTSSVIASKQATLKPAASTKVAASGTVSAKPTVSSVATSKPAASSVTASKPAGSSVTPLKYTASSTAPSKPGISTVTSSKTTTTSTATSKPSASSMTVSKSSISTATSSKTATTSPALSKTATSSTTPSKPGVTSVASKKPGLSSKPAASNIASSKPVASSTTPMKPAATSITTASSTSAKKPAAALPGKPTGGKTSTSSVVKPAITSTGSLKPDLEILPVNEATATILKSSSKPTTPTSNPTSPTMPQSPMVKSSGVKSPLKPEIKPPVTVKTSNSLKPAKDVPQDKKPLSHSDIKQVGKKAEVPKNPSTGTMKPSATTKPSTSGANTSSAIKPSPSTANKTTVTKPAAASTTKPKPPSASEGETSNRGPSAGAKNPTPTTVVKIADKTGKDVSGKLPVNGKTSSAKTTGMKTDPKGNTKNVEKSASSKKSEEGKKEEKTVQVQEQKVSTTNEFTNPTNDQQSMTQATEI